MKTDKLGEYLARRLASREYGSDYYSLDDQKVDTYLNTETGQLFMTATGKPMNDRQLKEAIGTSDKEKIYKSSQFNPDAPVNYLRGGAYRPYLKSQGKSVQRDVKNVKELRKILNNK